MKTTTKRILSILFTLSLALGLAAFLPVTASAAGFPIPPMVAGGDVHSLALKSDGTVWGWGSNWNGELADGTYQTSRLAPWKIISGAKAIAAGSFSAMALKSDGTVWAWGIGTHGEMGNGANETYNTSPVQVTVAAGVPLSGIVAISAGDANCLALKNDGTVWGWGQNAYGEAGDGTSNSRKYRAVQSMASAGVPLTGVVAVAAGSVQSMALKSDGTVWAWGGNRDGQLGNGKTDAELHYSVYPVQVITSAGVPLAGVANIAAGGTYSYYSGYSLALKSDGTVWAWGHNGDGKLGDGTDTERNRAVQVMASAGVPLSGVASVAASRLGHSLAVKNDGTALAWGDNKRWQLGFEGANARFYAMQAGGLNLGATTRVTFTAAQVGGTSGSADSTGIQLTFSQAVSGLTADDITIFNSAGAVKRGTLSGSGTAWTIGLSSVDTQGGVTVRIANFGTFNVTTSAQAVTVHKNTAGSTYAVTVTGGTASKAAAVAGETVTVIATVPSGKVFKEWTATPAVIFANKNSASTSFAMPASAVAVTAAFEDAPSSNTIFGTNREATFFNWILFFLGFGFIWMWFF